MSKENVKLGTMIIERIDDPDTDRIIERCPRSDAMDYLQHMKDVFSEWSCTPDISGEHLLDGSVDLTLTHRSPSLNNLHFRFIPDGKPFKMVRKIKGVTQAFARLGEAAKQFGKSLDPGNMIVDDFDDNTPINIEAYSRFISKPIKTKSNEE